MKVICYCFHDDKSKFSFNNIRSQSLLSSKCLWIAKRNLCFYSWQNSSKGIQKPEDAKLCHLVCLLIFKLFFKNVYFFISSNQYIFTVLSACFCLIGNKTVICHCSVFPTPFKYTYLCDSWLTQFGSVFIFYLHRMTWGILWFPQLGIEPVPHCSGSTVSYHWTTREFLTHTMF